MIRLPISFVFLIMLFALVTAYADDQPRKGPLLEEIIHEAVTDTTEKLIFRLSAAGPPKIFKIKGEKPRLVIDFFDTGFSAQVKKISTTDDHLIKSVRIGIHKDPPKTRVVVDLRTEREYDYEVNSEDQENTLTITFYFEGKSPEPDSGKEENVPAAEAQEPQKLPVPVIESMPEDPVSPPAAETAEQPEAPPGDNVVPSSDAAPEVAEKQTEEAPEEAESPAEMKVDATSQQAEERVNQIIANIKDPQPVAADPVLLDVTYESTANDSEMVLFKLNDFYPPIVFGIEKGNPRVVCDFLDTGLAGDIRPVIHTNGTFVSKIRTARHPNPEKVRVVLDLVPNKNYDLQQVFFKEDNLFVIIISEFEKESVKPLKTVPGSDQKQ